MTQNTQFNKNIELTEKLAEYISENPEDVKGLPQNASFVPFSSSDEELNKVNNKLVESLKKEGKAIIKALKTSDKRNLWKFTQVTY